MARFELWVPGRPVPQGSLRPMVSKSTGQAFIKNSSVLMAWRSKVTSWAIEAQAEQMHTKRLDFPLEGPIGVELLFYLARPKHHYGTGKNAAVVKDSSPAKPASAPDIDKLTRAVFDALTDAKVWHDDGQVVWVRVVKMWGDQEGVYVSLGTM